MGGGGGGGYGGGGGGAGGMGAGGGILGSGGSSPFSNVAGAGSGGGSSTAIDKTNAFGPSFSNPLYMGRPNQTLSITSSNSGSSSSGSGSGSSTALTTTNVLQGVGGFGSPSFGTSSGTATTTSGSRGGATGMSSGKSTTYSGATPMPTRLSYSATVKFATKPIAANEMQAELSGIINRSSSIKNPAAIQVVIEDQTIVLRGKVADDDERRLTENMIRMTPRVREVRNELQVP
jgi:hypothetical protein